MTTELLLYFFKNFCKCQLLNSLFRGINFLELSKYSWNLQKSWIIEKFKNWFFFFLNGRRSWKISTHFGTLVSQVEKLIRLWPVGTLESLLVHWHVKMRSWHAFGKLTRGHVDHTNTDGTQGTQFSKLTFFYKQNGFKYSQRLSSFRTTLKVH